MLSSTSKTCCLCGMASLTRQNAGFLLLKGRHAGVPDHCQCALSATRLWGAFSSSNVCVILLACEALVHQSSVPSTCLRTHQYSVSSSPRSPICEESLASLVHTLAPQFWQCMMGLALQSSMYCPEPHFSLAQYLKSGSCSIALRLIRLRQAVSSLGSANLSICFSEKMVRHESTQIGHRTVSCKTDKHQRSRLWTDDTVYHRRLAWGIFAYQVFVLADDLVRRMSPHAVQTYCSMLTR